jgi:hypothetical protein
MVLVPQLIYHNKWSHCQIMCSSCKGSGVIPFDYLNMIGGRFCACSSGKEAEEAIYSIVAGYGLRKQRFQCAPDGMYSLIPNIPAIGKEYVIS